MTGEAVRGNDAPRDRYRVSKEIAAGGTATVHLGRIQGAAGFERTVAIKKLRPHLAKDREFVAAFVDEARLASCIHHPNVVQTLDVVEQGDELLLAMEYVEGETLRRLLAATEDPAPIPIVAAIAAHVLAGLHAAHEAIGPRGTPLRLVHRDISPENVMVGTDGVARVLDFGVAKASWREQHTHDGVLKGKLAYMSPEQLRWQPLDRRADLFAASITLWELLTGERLFASTDPEETIRKILAEPIPSPSRHREIPAALEAVVMRGLSRTVGGRYSAALEMAVALEAATPLASPREVGTWVEEHAAEALASRRAAVAELARPGAIDESGEVTSISGVVPSPQLSPRLSPVPRAASRGARAWRLWLGSFAVVVVGAFSLLHLEKKLDDTPRGESAEPPGPPLPTAPPSPPPSVPPPLVGSEEAVPSPPRAPLSTLPRPAQEPSSAPRRSHNPPVTKPAPPKLPDCVIPYIIGPDGVRRFRPECV